MLRFSTDPQVAERQMQALIFYLTTFGYIDGDFDRREKDFVREYIRKLVEHRVRTGVPDADATLRSDLVERFTTHFHEVFESIDRHVRDLFTEAVAQDENQDAFVHSKLKLRCFEIFQSFDPASQEMLMDTVDSLIDADGEVHPAEIKFRAELAALFEADLGIEIVEVDGDKPRVSVGDPTRLTPKQETHPFFDQFEFHYSRDPDRMKRQVAADLELIERHKEALSEQQKSGAGKLSGKIRIDDIEPGSCFLDGHVYVHRPVAEAAYEVTVLGDLHGCYSCLKAALMQSEFLAKVDAYRRDASLPYPLLVLLGDYIDRGLFSLNGVLRSVMQLFVSAPEHVVALRGNHEYYLEYNGQIFGGVKPAEAINTLKPHLPVEVFQRYMSMFEMMPNMLLLDRTMFVHGGIPRDRIVKERWKDLSSLNDPDIRFQMMWSDPSMAEVIPAELQQEAARFPFGRLQAKAFLQRLGLTGLVRGHEKVEEGFRQNYEDDPLLVTLFSAGGATNDDLPADSSYRSVTPMAMTVTLTGGSVTVTPWAIDYERYNDPTKNGFFKAPPEIEHRVE